MCPFDYVAIPTPRSHRASPVTYNGKWESLAIARNFHLIEKYVFAD